MDTTETAIPIARYADDAESLAHGAFTEKHGRAFLMHQIGTGSLRPLGSSAGTIRIERGEAPVPPPQLDFMVFPVRKREDSVGTIAALENQIRLGRAEDNDIVVDDGSVSKIHAAFRWDGDACRLRDLGSSNGTTRRDTTLERDIEVELATGDRLTFGEVSLTYMAANDFQDMVAQLVRNLSR